MKFSLAPLLLLAAAPSTLAIDLDPTSTSSLVNAAQIAALNLIQYYDGFRKGGTIGMFQSPVYWWEAGAAWNAYVDFWHYTGNSSYNQVALTALQWQVGSNNDYLPSNFSTSAGNDDQAFWAMAAMTAAERNFTNPASNQPGWLALAQAVFNQQATRWDTQYCGGGLRWQVYAFNTGYTYKNSISTACFFNLAARLARYTGNQTYADWAEKVWQWQLSSGFTNSQTYAIYDGASIYNCSGLNLVQWTYNNGLFLGGAAYMYNFTKGNTTWQQRVDSLITRAQTDFFQNSIVFEPACEPYDICNVDQHSFKGYLTRNMGYTMSMYPGSIGRLQPLLQASAKAAAKACTGSLNGFTQMCGFHWTWNNGTYDGSNSVGFQTGQNMAALETIIANLALQRPAPYTNVTGGTSQGNAAAGVQGSQATPFSIKPATTADKAGAGILTALFVGGCVGFSWWLAF
ncbi:hydrolase 76 protein [Savitreella phatthalungensis]